MGKDKNSLIEQLSKVEYKAVAPFFGFYGMMATRWEPCVILSPRRKIWRLAITPRDTKQFMQAIPETFKVSKEGLQ